MNPVREDSATTAGGLLRFAGAAGFFAKGFLYTFVGVLILVTSLLSSSEDESPQGVFKKIQALSAGWGTAILSLLFVGMILYAIWRLFEAATGLGANADDGKLKRFFSHRLSPFISGCVYLSYAAFCIRLLFGLRSANNVCFPSCWRDTAWGTVLLALLGLAFLVAVVTQLVPAVTGNFRKDMRADCMMRWGRLGKSFLVLGRIGFLGRAALFAAVSALFWAYVFWPHKAKSNGSAISESLDQLTATKGGRVILTLIGLMVVCYGAFAALNSYFKRFLGN